MKPSALAALSSAFLLSGCSYAYTVLATVIDGHLAFVADPKTNARDCLNQIEVLADGPARAIAAPGDDAVRIGYGTFWFERTSYNCLNKWPIRYGVPLRGGPPEGERLEKVAAKPLRIGVVYRISTTSGSMGYGSGAFVIRRDRRVENVPVESAAPGNAS